MLDRVLALLVGLPFAVGAGVGGSGAGVGDDGGRVAFTFADPEIVESSGLVVDDGLFVTVNDSGDSGRVFVVDPATGRTVGRTTWSGDPEDAEALAPAGPGEVWVGDIGDNGADRDEVEVLRVPVGRGDRAVEPQRFRLTYPDGPRDAETLLAEPGTGRLVVVSKDFFGGTVYRAPRRLDPDGPNRLREVGPGVPIATDGAFFPDGRHLVVRDYGKATVLTWPTLDVVGSVDLPPQDQGEGIAVDRQRRVFVSTEGARTDVLRVPLPTALRKAVAPDRPGQDGAGVDGDRRREAPGSTAESLVERVADRLADPAAYPWIGGALALTLAALLARRSRRR